MAEPHVDASRTSKLVVSKEAMARIGRQMLKRKGVTEDEVNKLRVYQHAVEGRVHNDFHLPLAERRNLYERSNWKSLAVEKGEKRTAATIACTPCASSSASTFHRVG